METTLQPSLSENARSRIATIEAIELGSLAFAFWFLLALLSIGDPNTSFVDQFMFLAITEIVVLGSWAIYNTYIRIARAAGRTLDVAIWILASLATSSYTFWAWSILDVNRFLMAKLFYRGVAPVEYAWSARSKQIRRLWEQARKDGTA